MLLSRRESNIGIQGGYEWLMGKSDVESCSPDGARPDRAVRQERTHSTLSVRADSSWYIEIEHPLPGEPRTITTIRLQMPSRTIT